MKLMSKACRMSKAYIYIYLLESNQSRTKFRYTFSVCRDNNNSIIADRVARKDDDTEFWREF